MEFRVLGDLEVRHDGEAIALGAHQQRAVLAILVLHAGEVVSCDRLIDELWGDEPPARGGQDGAGLRVAAAQGAQLPHGDVRRADRHARPRVRAASRSRAGRPARLRATPRAGTARPRRARVRRAADVSHASALALWRGPPLADFTFDTFAAREIARLEELRLEALEIAHRRRPRARAPCGAGRRAGGAHRPSIRCASACAPQRMLALYRWGREPEALALYRDTAGCSSTSWGWSRARRCASCMTRSCVRTPRSARSAPRRRADHRPAIAARPRSASDGSHRRSRRCGRRGVAARDRSARPTAAVPRISVRPTAVGGHRPRAQRRRRADAGRRAARATSPPAQAESGWRTSTTTRSRRSIRGARRSCARCRPVRQRRRADDRRRRGVDDGRPDATVTAHRPRLRRRVKRTTWASRLGGVRADESHRRGSGSVWASTGSPRSPASRRGSGDIETTADVGNEPAAIADGAGATWVADDLDDTVSRIDRSGIVTGRSRSATGASAIAVGAGAVWVANTLDGTVTRIDPATSAPKATIDVGAGPTGIAVGFGAVWVANSLDGTVSRIDPRTDHVVATIEVGGSPDDVAVAAGRVWVSVQAGSPRRRPPLAGGTLRIVQQKDFNSTDPAILSSFGPQAAQLEFATCAKLLNYPDRPGSAGFAARARGGGGDARGVGGRQDLHLHRTPGVPILAALQPACHGARLPARPGALPQPDDAAPRRARGAHGQPRGLRRVPIGQGFSRRGDSRHRQDLDDPAERTGTPACRRG